MISWAKYRIQRTTTPAKEKSMNVPNNVHKTVYWIARLPSLINQLPVSQWAHVHFIYWLRCRYMSYMRFLPLIFLGHNAILHATQHILLYLKMCKMQTNLLLLLWGWVYLLWVQCRQRIDGIRSLVRVDKGDGTIYKTIWDQLQHPIAYEIILHSAVQKRSNLKTLTHRICWQHSKRDYLIQIILWWMCYCIVLNRWSIDLVQLVGRWIESEFQIEVEMEESIKLNALIIIDAVSAKIEDNKWSGEIRQFQV